MKLLLKPSKFIKKEMNCYKNAPIYLIFILSVLLQSYVNLYDTYQDYRNHIEYYKYRKYLEAIKNNINSTANFKFEERLIENFYIPKQAQFVRWYLKENPISSFRLSPLIIGVYNRYAILEGAYPIQVSDTSNYLVTTSNDILPKGCNVLDSKEGVQIVYCP